MNDGPATAAPVVVSPTGPMPPVPKEGREVPLRRETAAANLPRLIAVLKNLADAAALVAVAVALLVLVGWTLDIDELYGQANAGPADMDFLQAYDDYPVINLMQMEDLGFCEKGAAPQFVRDNTFTVDGSFPFNTNGGQLSVGQAGAAGGYLGMVEALRQLTGTAGGTQVREARMGLVSGFGMINYDRGLCTAAAILARSDA